MPNQFIINDDGNGLVYNQSCKKIMVRRKYSKIALDRIYWDCCKVISKYHNQFLGETEAVESAELAAYVAARVGSIPGDISET